MFTVLAIIFPIIAGIIASVAPERQSQKSAAGQAILPKFSLDALKENRNSRYASISLITLLLGLLAIFFPRPVTLIEFSENVTLRLELDALGKYFLIAVLILYTCVVFYAMEYMTMEENQNVFFAFFYVSLGALIAVCASGNLVTVYLFFEMATLTTVPLVLHEGTKAAIAAGMKYLFYSIGGALMGLFGVFFIYYYGAAGRNFTLGGFLDQAKVTGHRGMLLTAAFIAILGFGTKAGMYPMHGWLPAAHPIAPAPASALLSGIIAKAGVIAVIRLVFYSVGEDFLRGTWVQLTWMILAMLTIFMGSMMAFLEKNMKKRLAFSTISQISYIMLALSMLSETGLRGGLIHVMSHAFSKGCLFLCAGIFIYKLGKREVSDLYGIGKQMPITMWCFTIASLSLVGIPPMGGFLSKWVIAMAALNNGMGVLSFLPVVILLISALLTAGYLLPITFHAFFPGEEYDGPTENKEPTRLMTVPMICLCLAALFMGLFGVRVLWF